MTFSHLDELEHNAMGRIVAVSSLSDLDQLVRELTGQKSHLKTLLKDLRNQPPEIAERTNKLRSTIQKALQERRMALLDAAPLLEHPIDKTAPGEAIQSGGLHPVTQMMYDLNDAFAALNFDIYAGPEISSELYDFDYMNFEPDHPARASMDTYWLAGPEGAKAADRLCLRPHLTGASVRFLQRHGAPCRFVYPGRVYRNEDLDARHERAFFQYELLIVDKDISFTAGQLMIQTILSVVFGRDVKTRMRAGFFPFVEPGFEIDMQCLNCGGKGCSVCKGIGWLEVMPGGVPHPNVLTAGGLDPDVWSGFYVNIGLDRLVMMRYGIDDVRIFHSGDLRVLQQFK